MLKVRALVVAVATALAGSAAPPQATTAAAADPATPPSTRPVDESLTIEFPPAGAALSPSANAMLDGAARLYRNAQPEVMIVSGHTDKVGTEFSNLVLAAKRANTVKKALVDRGVPADRLQLVAVGWAELTPKDQARRAVVVTWR